jgi:hypothetical protein
LNEINSAKGCLNLSVAEIIKEFDVGKPPEKLPLRRPRARQD